ncbi:hypothetical protein FRC11_012887 [Ceratobasidium sp. 423]|nr:hypothetical protein FRC11_012887 [Ceratobasidium sp. 423]
MDPDIDMDKMFQDPKFKEFLESLKIRSRTSVPDHRDLTLLIITSPPRPSHANARPLVDLRLGPTLGSRNPTGTLLVHPLLVTSARAPLPNPTTAIVIPTAVRARVLPAMTDTTTINVGTTARVRAPLAAAKATTIDTPADTRVPLAAIAHLPPNARALLTS